MANRLDDLKYISKLDKSKMLALLTGFSDQLKDASEYVRGQVLPKAAGISNIVFTGMGGSAIAGDLVKGALSNELKAPFIVNRDYYLPGFVSSRILLFVSSYSGDTEETLSAYKAAKRKKARIVVITSGGALGKMASKDGYPLIKIPAGIPPRAALGYLFVPALTVLSKMGLIKDKEKDINEAVNVLTGLRRDFLGPDVPLKKNIAKKTALALVGRIGAIYGWSGSSDCAVTRLRSQINENSKALAISHLLPEMDHNEIVGYVHPKRIINDVVVVFLRDEDDPPRITDRVEITSSIIKNRVHKIIEIKSGGEGPLARICSLIYIGDFISFYLAILNGEDPSPVDEITFLKKELSKRKYI